MQTIMHAPPKYCNHRVYKFLSNASKVLKNEKKRALFYNQSILSFAFLIRILHNQTIYLEGNVLIDLPSKKGEYATHLKLLMFVFAMTALLFRNLRSNVARFICVLESQTAHRRTNKKSLSLQHSPSWRVVIKHHVSSVRDLLIARAPKLEKILIYSHTRIIRDQQCWVLTTIR